MPPAAAPAGYYTAGPFELDEVPASLAEQERHRSHDSSVWRRPLASARHLLKKLSHRPMVSRHAMLVTIGIAVFAVFAASAQAKLTDPRKCGYGLDKRAQCAHAAAQLVTRKVLQKRVGLPYLWQGPLVCTSQGTLLRWRCAFADQFPQLPPQGYVAVTYRASSTGWHVYTSIVATP